MRYLIDLTKENFNRIDFTEAEIVDFYCRKILPDCFEFSIWGATINLDQHWKHDKSFYPNHDNKNLYVSGIGTIRIRDLIGGSIEVYIYDNIKDEHSRTMVAKNHDGSKTMIRREWGHASSNSESSEYLWECVMAWPYGFCNLRLNVNGKVEYEFDTNDAISVDAFLKNPHIYDYKEI
ncbi:MAG: hypothetical protein FWG53_05295 [Clostridiales bacterium]|nr:hypothetical protein [Clostridiales bacterium]